MNRPLFRLTEALLLLGGGLRLTGWGLIVAAVMFLVGGCFVLVALAGRVGEGVAGFGLCFAGGVVIALSVAACGGVAGFVGRCRCLACPPELVSARAAVRLAVLLESIGWLQLVSTVAYSVAVAAGWVPLPSWLASVGLSMAALLLLAGWGFFALFCRRLAGAVELGTTLDQRVTFGVPVVLAVTLLIAGAVAVAQQWWFLLLLAVVLGPVVVGGVGLVCGSAVGRLAAACRRAAFTDDSTDPDEEPPCEPPSDEWPTG